MSICTRTYLEAGAKAARIDLRLRAGDPRLQGSVLAVHRDGSVFLFDSAFVVVYGAFFLILTEHHGPRVYEKSDLIHIRALGPQQHTRTVR